MPRTSVCLRASILAATVLVSALWATQSAASSSTLVYVFGPAGTQHLVARTQGQAGTIDSIPLTLNPNGQTAFGGRLQSLAIAGANAADFAIVPGGTCVPGSTTLFPVTTTSGTSCTVNVRYTPSTSAVETASLTASCTAIGLVGGFSIVCNDAVGNVAALVGTLLQPIPALSPTALTALAVALFVLGSFAALRRTDPHRR